MATNSVYTGIEAEEVRRPKEVSHIETITGRLTKRLLSSRRLKRSAVQRIQENGARSLLVVCVDENTEAALEAALAFALRSQELSGETPLVVDFDGSSDSLSRYIGAQDMMGLSDRIASDNQHPTVLETERVHFLPFGTKREVRSDVAARTAIETLTSDHKETYNLSVWVARSPLPEEQISLAALFDGVILAVRAEKARMTAARDIKQRLEDAGAQIVGAVLCRRRLTIPNWLYSRL